MDQPFRALYVSYPGRSCRCARFAASPHRRYGAESVSYGRVGNSGGDNTNRGKNIETDMNNSIVFVLLITTCLIFSCKKEKNNQGTVEFDVDGVHHSFIPEHAAIEITSHGKRLGLDSPHQGNNYYTQMYVTDDSASNSSLLRPITYTGYTGFRLLYDDCFNCHYDTGGDTANVESFEVISCSGYPSVINATFHGTFQFGEYDTSCLHPKQITNGKITNVIYSWYP
jgi:hypothetical protein